MRPGISLESLEFYISAGSGWQGVGSFAAILAVMLAMARIGRLVPCRAGGPDLAFFAGWGIASLALTLTGLLFRLPLYWGALPLCLLFAATFFVRLGGPGLFSAGRWRVAAMTGGFLFVSLTSGVAGTDSFSYWVPNAWYLHGHDAFPPLSAPLLYYPAHPYNFQLIDYLAGLVLPYFPTTGLIAANGLFLVGFALLIVEALREDADTGITWARATASVLIATVLNPTFVPALIFTSYGDCATGVTVAVIGYAMARLAAKPAAERSEDWRGYLAIGLALAALVNSKQSNMAQTGALIVGFIAIGGLRGNWRQLVAVMAPCAVLYLVWRHHVSIDGLAQGENQILPFAQWNWAVLPSALRSMLSVVLNKGGYFGLAALLAVRLIYPWIKRAADPARAILLLSMIQFIAFNIFLVITYVAVFSVRGGETAQSYWRFNTQLGPLLMIAFLHAFRPQIAALGRRVPRLARQVAVPLCLIVPVAIMPRLRIDVANQQAQLFLIGRELLASLPQGRTLDIVLGTADPAEASYYNGVMRVAMFMTDPVRPDLTVRWHTQWSEMPPDPDMVWLACAGETAAAGTGLSDIGKQTALIEKRGEAWTKLESWAPPICR